MIAGRINQVAMMTKHITNKQTSKQTRKQESSNKYYFFAAV